MERLLKKLCSLNGTSGREEKVRNFIIENIKDHCEYTVDKTGNIICLKKGKLTSDKRIMLDAHMDEVGFIVTYITDDGFLKFDTVGGIDVSVIMTRKVVFDNGVTGVVSSKPIHLLSADESKKMPKTEDLFIDIGSTSKQDAERYVKKGDTAVFCSEYTNIENRILSKAIDDRAGCAVLIKLLQSDALYDFYATFSWGEEIGCRGAKTATFEINPDYAIVLEATTASDILGVDEDKTVCKLGKGVAVSFMDRSTLYDKELFDLSLRLAEENGIPCQVKSAVAGGNNSGAIHQSRTGVKTIALSVPCRYIHSASSVADLDDIAAAYNLAKVMLREIAK